MASFSVVVGRVRTASAGNPISFSYTVNEGDAVVALLLKCESGTNRGGTPTLGAYSFESATAVPVKAAATPEVSVEEWYVLHPKPGTYTLTIPNALAITIQTTVVVLRLPLGALARFASASSANNTSTNPTITPSSPPRGDGTAAISILGSGANTWNPSAQTGTAVANTDDGGTGGTESHQVPHTAPGAWTWTFGTSDDWAIIIGFFTAVPPKNIENYHRPKCSGSGISIGSIG